MIEVIQTTSTTQLGQDYVQWPTVVNDISNTAIKPLFCFKSQATKKELCWLPTFGPFYTQALGEINERYMLVFFFTIASDPGPGGANPLIGILQMGTTDYPYGLYDVTIYENNMSGNLDPANAIKPVWYGLMNLIPETTNPAVEYKEYATNDTDTESVYITF
jgi:hypothetical protein|tara:strand:- start:592 stop:1077 length:486 start_codon:yes stop_codon:yes gene_type:complete